MEILQFKHAMSKLPTGIAILTVADQYGKMGITLSTFNSLSLDPLLVMFTLKLGTARYKRIVESEYFTLNLLSEDQQELSKSFAHSGELDWRAIELGASKYTNCPIIKDVSAYFDCKLYKILEGGDHSIVTGLVLDVACYDKKPLVYHDRQYKKI